MSPETPTLQVDSLLLNDLRSPIPVTLYIRSPLWVLEVIVTSVLYHKGILEQYNLSKYVSAL